METASGETAISPKGAPVTRLTSGRGRSLEYLWAAASISVALVGLRAAVDLTAALYLSIQLTMAVLFLIRRPALAGPSSILSCLVAISSMLYAFLYRFCDSAPSILGEVLVGTGAFVCLLSMLSLGDCFGVLPAFRGVRKHGMYNLIRHPIYFSYVLMDVGIVLSYPTLWNAILFAVAFWLFVWRIKCEEEVLSRFQSYREYADTVRYRLIPRIY